MYSGSSDHSRDDAITFNRHAAFVAVDKSSEVTNNVVVTTLLVQKGTIKVGEVPGPPVVIGILEDKLL